MHWADGVYLLKGRQYSLEGGSVSNRFICFVQNEYRSAGMTIIRPVKDIYTGQWPYMSMEETTEGFHITYVCSENFIHGIAVVNPTMTGKDLLEQLGIDYMIED